jgi:hypothetical protein
MESVKPMKACVHEEDPDGQSPDSCKEPISFGARKETVYEKGKATRK